MSPICRNCAKAQACYTHIYIATGSFGIAKGKMEDRDRGCYEPKRRLRGK